MEAQSKMNLHELTLHEARKLLTEKKISAVELTRALLARIDQVEGKVDAYITVDAEGALAQAEAARPKLEALNGGADTQKLRVQLEVLIATVQVALGDNDAALASFERALAESPRLELDPVRR